MINKFTAHTFIDGYSNTKEILIDLRCIDEVMPTKFKISDYNEIVGCTIITKNGSKYLIDKSVQDIENLINEQTLLG